MTRPLPSRAAVIGFFVVVLFLFSHPLADGDLWWHLNTGRWIVAHRALPDEDPFTFTVSAEYADRARMSVRSNWLAQTGYYALYRVLGLNGLRGFNAALFTLIVFAIYRSMRWQGLGVWWALFLTSPCAAIAWHYDELRPFGFSVLFTALYLHLIERARLRQAGGRARSALVWLIPLSLLWANMHRGFPLMYLLLGPCAAVWLWRRRYRDALWLAAAGGVSLLNPSGIVPVIAAGSESFQGTADLHIIELARPWEFARITGIENSYLPLLVVIIGGSLLFMSIEWRRLSAEHVLLYASFAVAGLTAFRYSIYLVVVAAAVCAPYAARVLERGAPARVRSAAALGVAGAMGAMIWCSERPTTQAVYAQGLPIKAVAVMLEQRLPGPLLNHFDWGGYISWATWPRYKVFVDSRILDFSVLRKLEGLAQGSAAPLLREYGINTVIYPSIDRANLRSSRVVRDLMADPDWKLAYFDATAAVFARRSAAPSAPEASRQDLGAYLLSVVAYRTRGRPASAEDLFETAAILGAMGRAQQAADAYAQGRSMLSKLGPGAGRPAQ